MESANMAQATSEDCAAAPNLMTANLTLFEQVALYANLLSTKEADNAALQTTIKTYSRR